MKKKKKYGILLALVCVIGCMATAWFYIQYTTERIYTVSTENLQEVYTQVNASFQMFVQRNWRLLNGWSSAMLGQGVQDDDRFDTFVQGQKERWNFTDFYFMDEAGNYRTVSGKSGQMQFGGPGMKRLEGGVQNAAMDALLPDGENVPLFVSSVSPGAYRGFPYSAVGISYNQDDIRKALNVRVFGGKAECCVVYSDGKTLFSTWDLPQHQYDYLAHLREDGLLHRKTIEEVEEDWQNGASDVVRYQIDGVWYYLVYQPVGFQGWMLLGIVREDVANVALNEIRWVTVEALAKIFLLIGLCLVIYLVRRSRIAVNEKEVELQFQEELFSVLSSSVDEIFLLLEEENWKVNYVSPNVERLLGVSAEAVRENVRLLGETVAGDERFLQEEEMRAIPVGGSLLREREHIHAGTGERRWFKDTFYHVQIQDSHKYVIVLSDDTTDIQMIESLKVALDAAKNANEAKSHFLSNMSHDIRTPMNAIVGFSMLLGKDAEQADKVREYARKITTSSQHLLSLINDVLDMSKIESGKTSLNLTEFSMPDLLEELQNIILPQARAKKQSFEIYVKDRVPETVLGDKLRVNQVMLNLLSNAVKYTPEGGRIELDVSNLRQAQYHHNAHLRFVVSDNGIGMSADYLKTIFDPFTREANAAASGIQGTGLGMAITKNLVDLMGGTISVQSTPGQGSTFTVEMEFARAEQLRDGHFWERNRIFKAFVVDDEEEICQEICSLMDDTGVQVDYATTGQTAVERIREAHLAGGSYDIILLDWKMPDMDGVTTARKIREAVGHDVPILILTAYDWAEIEDEARAAGITAFMPKPFFVSTLQHTIEDIRGTADGEAPLQAAERSGEGGAAQDKADPGSLSGLFFLVAEDVDLNAEILSELLRIEGADCEIAVNGQEALERFQASEPGRYDMILMDVQMPVMDGYAATRAIRACGHPDAASIPIVAMTANAFSEDVKNALDSGMNAHVAKPVDMAVLKETLAKLRKAEPR